MVHALRSGSPELTRLASGGLARTIVSHYGRKVIIEEFADELTRQSWPQPLLDQAALGLHRLDHDRLLTDWVKARNSDGGEGLEFFALTGLLAAPWPSPQVISAAQQWRQREEFPMLAAWLTVVRSGNSARRDGAKLPAGLDRALWALPLTVLDEWARFAFNVWPGAPYELLLPPGTAQEYEAWGERAVRVLSTADSTWIPSAQVDKSLRRAADQWIAALRQACDGEAAEAAVWLEGRVYGPGGQEHGKRRRHGWRRP